MHIQIFDIYGNIVYRRPFANFLQGLIELEIIRATIVPFGYFLTVPIIRPPQDPHANLVVAIYRINQTKQADRFVRRTNGLPPHKAR